MLRAVVIGSSIKECILRIVSVRIDATVQCGRMGSHVGGLIDIRDGCSSCLDGDASSIELVDLVFGDEKHIECPTASEVTIIVNLGRHVWSMVIIDMEIGAVHVAIIVVVDKNFTGVSVDKISVALGYPEGQGAR